MITTAIGLFMRNAEIIGAGIASVAIDQTLWWFDILSFILTRKFKIGVAAYLAWEDTTISRMVTTTHHLWFIPLCMVALKVMKQGLPWSGFRLSVKVFIVLSQLSRLLVPFKINMPDGSERYINMNCSHECWKDIKVPFFHITDGAAWYKGFWMLMFVWNGGNFFGFCLYKLISKLLLERKLQYR
jgi:hypothetical protein